ncbi:MAG TPA: endonuclease NucS [Anaerolineae bacterium]|nr:endonuclease NucS [Anaerolineae bacterium]HOR01195.1 endonuclease NucS [Anaerolineae bacterium]HPL26640.1 endonuclease NucS [Anaerolineae bacterium]
MRIYSITSDDEFQEYAEICFQDEHQEAILEAWLDNNPGKIIEDGGLLIIGRQVTTNLGGFIDLLAVDRQGDLVVIELKRDRTPRDTLAQVLEYASFGERLGYERLEDILRSYSGNEAANLAQYHRECFALAADEAVVFNNDQRIVIVGQRITPEIRQTSAFLRNKGVRITCIEFTFFRANGGLRLLSTNIVVGSESDAITRVSSASLPQTTEAGFIASLDQNGKQVFGRLLEFARANAFPVHWGQKGFSLNVDLQGTHVPFCFCYPPDSVFHQSVYTALVGRGGLLSKVDMPDDEMQSLLAHARDSGLFQPAGREVKYLITGPLAEDRMAWLLSWLTEAARAIQNHGLKVQSDSQA